MPRCGSLPDADNTMEPNLGFGACAAMLERFQGPAWVTDATGRIVTANPRFARDAEGCTPNAVIGRTIKELFGPEDSARYENAERMQISLAPPHRISPAQTGESGPYFVHHLPSPSDPAAKAAPPPVESSQCTTDFQRLENALRQQRRQLSESQRIAKLGSWEIFPQTGEQMWSDGLFRILELDSEKDSPSLANLVSAVYWEDRRRVLRYLSRIRRGQPCGELEFRLLAHGQTAKYVHGRHEAETDAYGKVTVIRGTLQDITTHKQLEISLLQRETELREARNRLAAIVQTIPDILWLKDANGVFLACNYAFENFFGLSQENIVGKTDYDLVPKEQADAFRQNDKEVMASRAVAVIEEDLTCTATGQRARLETRKVPTFGADGEIIGVLGVARDITHLSRLENEVVHRERAFRSLVENSPDAIARYNTESRCLYGNPAMKILTGLSDEGLFGKKPSEMPPFAGNAGKAYLDLVEHVITYGRPGTVELHWENNGLTACMQLRIAPEFDTRGHIISVLAIGRDILALKQAEQRLRESRDRLRDHARHREDALENERRDLSRQIHEDLAQNLSALRLSINLLETQAGPHVPEGSFEGLRKIIDQCMAQSRNMATTLRPRVLDMGISTALQWLSDNFARDAGLAIRLNLPENLHLDDDYTTYLFRAAQEALSNIIRHAQASEVSLTLRPRGQHIVLKVCDNGRGLDRKLLSQETTFGLFWMHEQALQLGGTLQVASSPGKGTIIDIRLPLHR